MYSLRDIKRVESIIVMAVFMLAGFITTSVYAYNKVSNQFCSEIQWASDKTFEINTISFNCSESRDAVKDPARRINAVGDQWFDFSWSETSSAGRMNFQSEVWADPLDNDTLAVTYYSWMGCQFFEVDIIFNSDFIWDVDSPTKYWMADQTNQSGDYYLRPVALHELLHAVGLDHEDDAYSFMNYGIFPWANRDDLHEMIEPLPDDRQGLRAIYESSGSECDAAVLNTWVDKEDIINDSNGDPVAIQKLLCKPGGGEGFSDLDYYTFYDNYCGDDQSSSANYVCPGDYIYTRFTIANYSTVDLTFTEELWFSANTEWSTNDTQSSDTYTRSVSANTSHRDGRKFRVPNSLSPGTVYYPIIKINQSSCTEEAYRNNWIPLTGKIHIKSLDRCANFTSSSNIPIQMR